jgi:AraC-like DNA-binding protein
MESENFLEQFIPDHVFVYIVKGGFQCYDGSKSHILRQGDYALFRKNHLIKYVREKANNKAEFMRLCVFEETEFIRLCLEEDILKKFQDKHQADAVDFKPQNSFLRLKKNKLIPDFIRSLKLIYHHGEIDNAFADVKQEELLIILLQRQPELAGILFDFGKPEKINIEEFMLRNYRFNVSVDQFAYLTGRSLSAFKRDFRAIFNETPSRWLVQKRLQEAYFLLHKKHQKPSEIYLELGFETFSHFSAAFKKQFGLSPTELIRQKQNAISA